MATQLEQLAKYYEGRGNTSRANLYHALAGEERSTGGPETILTPVIPEGARRLPDLTIGGKTPKQLEEALISGGFRVSSYARNLLRSRDFTTFPDQQNLSLVRVTVSDLGLTGYPTIDQIYAKAVSLGLELCPAEVGPQLRLVYKDQPLGELLYIGMKQITDSHGYPYVFELDRHEGDSWLHCGWADPGDRWFPEGGFVFSLRK